MNSHPDPSSLRPPSPYKWFYVTMHGSKSMNQRASRSPAALTNQELEWVARVITAELQHRHRQRKESL